jgi:NitT/TauT family transport system substrate-binding protein
MGSFELKPGRTNGILFVALLVAAIFGPLGKNAGAEVVNMAISTVGLYELPTEIAKRKRFYAEEGLEVRKIAVRTGLQAAALLAGELDYSTVTGIIMRGAMQGMPLKTVMGWFDRPLHVLVARPPINNIAELKGKKVAVSAFGSTPHVMLREALASARMNPDRDITILAVGGSGERLAALAAGTVDATPLDVAYIDRTDKLGFNQVLFFGDMVKLRLGGLATSQDKIQKNPGQIARVIRATLKGVRFLKSNKPETLAVMRDYLKIEKEYVEKIYQFALKSLNENGTVDKESLATEMRLTKEYLKIKEDTPEEKIADWRFIKEAIGR